MSRTGTGLVLAGALGIAAGCLAFLLLHAAFAHTVSPGVLELTSWTSGMLATPSKSGLAAACLLLWNRPIAGAAVFCAILFFMFAAYGVALWGTRREHCPRVSTLVIAFLGFAAPLLATVPVLCGDVFAYLSLGEIADRGINPYTMDAVNQRGIEARALSPQLRNESIYGPLASRLFQIFRTDGLTLFQQVSLFRAFAVASLIATALLVASAARGLRRSEREARWAVMALLWNPLVLFECVVSVHLDVWVLLFSAAGLCLVARERVRSGLSTLLLTIALRATNALALPASAAFAWNRFDRGPRGITAAAGVLAAAAAGFVVWLVPDWLDANPLAPLRENSHFAAASVPMLVRDALQPTGIPGKWTIALSRVVFLVILLVGVARVRSADRFVHRHARDWLLFLLFFMSWMQPWYCIGAFAAVLLCGSPGFVVTLLLLSVSFPAAHYCALISSSMRYPSAWVAVLGLGPPIVAFLVTTVRGRRAA